MDHQNLPSPFSLIVDQTGPIAKPLFGSGKIKFDIFLNPVIQSGTYESHFQVITNEERVSTVFKFKDSDVRP
ncbi:MAG: hypothetical protein E6Z15_20805, partial [Paenibacillus macerans]|nr:hypothetical protein [Paenibacillus macerans]